MSSRISMDLRDGGWMRPTVAPEGAVDTREEARKFRAICPGVRLDAPVPETATVHPTFGRYVSAWRGRAADDETRAAGSSAGVLTAMSTFLVTTGRARSVRGAAMSPAQPTRTVPVSITSREEALAAAGSRYAPVSALDGFDVSSDAIVAKPCEISALTRLRRLAPGGDDPLTLSFFCAGTPSQSATRSLVTKLGVEVDRATSVRYRGNGWPGEFVATDGEARGALSYDDSWGKHLGRDLQWRCKICPDGTGEDADIAVGDFWKADDRGYPLFDDADGESVVIARTLRGHELLMEATRQGVIVLGEVDLDDVERIQPLQRARKRTLPLRILARRLALRKVPRFTGYVTLRRAVGQPKAAAKTLIGTVTRSWRDRLNGRST
ncbi:MAG: Coenzyme F420 hydrogenase/dehydrogenase, beta subunit C-terminal domain [Microbacterium sp.]